MSTAWIRQLIKREPVELGQSYHGRLARECGVIDNLVHPLDYLGLAPPIDFLLLLLLMSSVVSFGCLLLPCAPFSPAMCIGGEVVRSRKGCTRVGLLGIMHQRRSTTASS